MGALALLGALLLTAPSVGAEEGQLSGLWREVGSPPNDCQGCLSIVRHGTVFTVVSEAGWSGVATVDSYGYQSYAGGTAQWRHDVGAKHAEAPLQVQLALGGGRLFIVLVTKSDRGRSPPIKAIYERRPPAEDKGMAKVLKIKTNGG